jgi:DNA-binding response OmpR family regulator
MNKILIIEDDANTTDILKDLLGQHGYEVEVIQSGKEGLLSFKEIRHDLVLLNVALPDKDGLDVLEEIKRISSVPVIMLADKDSKVTTSTILYSKANDCLTKPFYVGELLTRIEVQLPQI